MAHRHGRWILAWCAETIYECFVHVHEQSRSKTASRIWIRLLNIGTMKLIKRSQSKRRAAFRGSILGAALVAVNCFPPVDVTPPPADAPASLLAITGAAVL